MKLQNFRINKGVSSILLLSLVLVACGGGSVANNSADITGAVRSAPPVVSLSAASNSIISNASTDITWSSTNSSSCTSPAGGGSSTTGSFNTGALPTTTTYTVTCVGAGGSASQSTTVTVASTAVPPTTTAVPPTTIPSTIASVQAAWAATPLPDTASGMTGAVHYVCDCGTGASGSCAAGSDSNNGLSTSTPKQTIASAITTLNSAASGDTVALCKGGAFNATGQLNINTSCTAGKTCYDLREYTPTTFAGTAKPIINSPTGLSQLVLIAGNHGGVRLLNLSFKGRGDSSFGFFIYNGPHDVTLGNLTVDHYKQAFYVVSGNETNTVLSANNVVMTGNTITNSSEDAFLGGGNNITLSYNYMLNNGSNNSLYHAIYISSHQAAKNIQIVGNYIYGQDSPTCLGGPIVAHGAVDGLNISSNWVEIAPAATTGGCYGISINNNATTYGAQYFRNAVISNNTLINTGALGIQVTTCPSCRIENNVISFNKITQGTTGIQVGAYPAVGSDDVNNANKIVNNTIYYDSGASGYSRRGIQVSTEGTGHIVANNTVSSFPASGSVTCFDYFAGLTLANYAFSNNNSCYSATTYTWEAAQGSTLAGWQSYARSYGFDTASLLSNPSFVANGTNFTPAGSSSLIGAGSTTYKSTLDKAGKTRPSTPAIGAYEP